MSPAPEIPAPEIPAHVSQSPLRLSGATKLSLPPQIARFGYDRAAHAVGIVHLGIGAFHRAHQAWYTDLAIDSGDRDWMIAGVSMRSSVVAEQMNPQEGLYTVTERSAAGSRTRLIGAVREVVVASREARRLADLLCARQTKIVSLTVTEKGYCRAGDGGLDHELAGRGSFFPLLAEAFHQRRAAGIAGLTLLSCDNLAGNGARLAALMREYLGAQAPNLVAWFEAECACPATMIDRIVPATTDADRLAISKALGGVRDEAAVVAERFSQWIIEDRFAGPRPGWDAVGAQLVSDVVPYEIAKLRMLNGAHSALAYLGLKRGHRFVHEAIADPQLRPLIDRLMRDEAAPSFIAAPGQDLGQYADDLIARFANPALDHKLIQIAMDGSQKLPQRWFATLAANRRQGRASPAILTALGAWLGHVRGDNGAVDDPLAARLAALWQGSSPADMVNALFGPAGHFSAEWTMHPDDRALLLSALG